MQLKVRKSTKKYLEKYPYIGSEWHADRIYLEDYFDSESIEIDKLLYMGLMNRLGVILGLLKESGNETLYAEVKKCYREME